MTITPFKTFSRPDYNDYVDQIVAFIDIMGFDTDVRNINSKADFDKVANLLSVLKQAEEIFNKEETLFRNVNATAISDSLIFTIQCNNTNEPCKSLIIALHMIQYTFIKDFSRLIRGYMTKGPVYHKEHIIFGRGYSNAYKKENEIGHAPRIVIDPILVEGAKDNVNKISDYIIEDLCDGYYFIDYLKPVGVQGASITPQSTAKAEREKIKNFIDTNLKAYAKDEQKIRPYKWLNNYFTLTDHYFVEK